MTINTIRFTREEQERAVLRNLSGPRGSCPRLPYEGSDHPRMSAAAGSRLSTEASS
jgi:hypothetical protein